MYAVWSLRDVFEENNPPSSSAVVRDPVTAAVWFLYAGKVLKERSIEGRDFDGRKGKEGDAIGEKGWKGLNKDRWEFWIENLERLGQTMSEGEAKILVEKGLRSVQDM